MVWNLLAWSRGEDITSTIPVKVERGAGALRTADEELTLYEEAGGPDAILFLGFCAPIVDQDTTVVIHRRVEWNLGAGAPPSGWEGGSRGGISSLGVRDARWAKTHLWPGPSSFYYVQLLPAAAAIENCAGARCARSRACAGARRVWISACGVCGHAGTCASVNQRAEKRHAFDGTANVEAAGLQEAAKETAKKLRGTASTNLSGAGGQHPIVLAGALLRLQRVYKPEEEGKTGLYAP